MTRLVAGFGNCSQSAMVPPVALGVPVSESLPAASTDTAAFAQPAPNVAEGQAMLAAKHSFPRGLLQSMEASVQTFPLRIWLVDNSGSMSHTGGSRILTSGNKIARVNATRWAELGDSVAMASEITIALGARTDFHLLNPTPTGQFFTVGYDNDHCGIPPNKMCDLAGIAAVMNESPRGRTPLTEATQRIVSAISPMKDKLIANGQQVVVVIATDGLPDDSHTFLTALQGLQSLPVWTVVRLCTDEEHVVEYWSELDKHLEAPLEVLDDLMGEATEIAAVTPWLTYGPPLHFAREFGCKNKLFDLLDEVKLLPSQAKELVEIILGSKQLPQPELDPAEFMRAVNDELQHAAPVFHPLKLYCMPWFDVKKMGRVVGQSRAGSCNIS